MKLSYWAVHSCGAVCHTVQGGSNSWVCAWNPVYDHSNESHWLELSCDPVYYAVDDGSNFEHVADI